MKSVAFLLITVLCLTSCTTIQNPTKPGVQYASIQQCQADNPPTYIQAPCTEGTDPTTGQAIWQCTTDPSAMVPLEPPGACQEVWHKQATATAVLIGTYTLYTLLGIVVFAYILAGGR